MCVYVYIYMYTYMCIYVYMFICIYVYMYICTYVYTYLVCGSVSVFESANVSTSLGSALKLGRSPINHINNGCKHQPRLDLMTDITNEAWLEANHLGI